MIVVHESALCAGRESNVTLSVTGGEGPYHWTLGDGSAWHLDEDTGASVTVSGAPQDGGTSTFSVTVFGAHGGKATQAVSLEVFSPPRVDTSLPHACPGEAYSTTLHAVGDDASAYQWSIASGDGGAISAQGNILSANPVAPGPISFTATVSDGHCSSDATELTLQVDGVGLNQCPSIGPDVLPEPCAGSTYTAQAFSAKNGTAPYVFRALSLPDGLVFNPDAASVSGVSKGGGTLVMQVTDGAGHVVQKGYTMTPRDTCWLAYQSTSSDAHAGLHFYDPVLAFDRQFANSAAVSDALFSPDGRALVYRTTTSGTSSLVLVAAPGWNEQPLSFAGSVDHYAWSPDSRTLAVAYHVGANGFLGGVAVSGAGVPGDAGPTGGGVSPEGGGAPAGALVTALAAASVSVGSELVWLGNSRVAFLVLGPDGGIPTIASVSGTAVSSVVGVDVVTYDSDSTLEATPSGLFVVDSDFEDIAFYGGFDQGRYGLALTTQFDDPQGQYVASVAGSQLQVYRTVRDGFGTPFATSTGGCGAFLAWSANNERIACTNDPSAGAADEGTIFTLDGTTTTLAPAPIRGTQDYTIGASSAHRRAFSRSGDWFAFVLPSELGVASLADGTPHVVTYALPPTGTPVGHTDDLAFSPDEHFLLWQTTSNLLLGSLQSSSVPMYTLVQGSLAPAVQCTDQFIDDPTHWCGASTPSPQTLAWSPDSRFAAAKRAQGDVEVFDFASLGDIGTNNACAGQCGFFAFQP